VPCIEVRVCQKRSTRAVRKEKRPTNVEDTEEAAQQVTALESGAGDGDRTRDIQLGKLAFYR
jgi:hypothetical protein